MAKLTYYQNKKVLLVFNLNCLGNYYMEGVLSHGIRFGDLAGHSNVPLVNTH